MLNKDYVIYELENPTTISVISIFVLILLAIALLVFIRYLMQKNGKSFLFTFIGVFLV